MNRANATSRMARQEDSPRLPVILAITGASGAPYALRLLEQLVLHEVPTWLIVSSHGFRLLETEADVADLAALRKYVGEGAFDRFVTVYDDNDRGARPASGSTDPSGQTVHAGQYGVDAVEFGFAAHKGTELLPLNKSASGGELSRGGLEDMAAPAPPEASSRVGRPCS